MAGIRSWEDVTADPAYQQRSEADKLQTAKNYERYVMEKTGKPPAQRPQILAARDKEAAAVASGERGNWAQRNIYEPLTGQKDIDTKFEDQQAAGTNNFTAQVGAGTDSLQGGMYRLMAEGAEALGWKSATAYAMKRARSNEAAAEAVASMSTRDIQNVGDLFKFGLYGFGRSLPEMGGAMALSAVPGIGTAASLGMMAGMGYSRARAGQEEKGFNPDGTRVIDNPLLAATTGTLGALVGRVGLKAGGNWGSQIAQKTGKGIKGVVGQAVKGGFAEAPEEIVQEGLETIGGGETRPGHIAYSAWEGGAGGFASGAGMGAGKGAFNVVTGNTADGEATGARFKSLINVDPNAQGRAKAMEAANVRANLRQTVKDRTEAGQPLTEEEKADMVKEQMKYSEGATIDAYGRVLSEMQDDDRTVNDNLMDDYMRENVASVDEGLGMKAARMAASTGFTDHDRTTFASQKEGLDKIYRARKRVANEHVQDVEALKVQVVAKGKEARAAAAASATDAERDSFNATAEYYEQQAAKLGKQAVEVGQMFQRLSESVSDQGALASLRAKAVAYDMEHNTNLTDALDDAAAAQIMSRNLQNARAVRENNIDTRRTTMGLAGAAFGGLPAMGAQMVASALGSRSVHNRGRRMTQAADFSKIQSGVDSQNAGYSASMDSIDAGRDAYVDQILTGKESRAYYRKGTPEEQAAELHKREEISRSILRASRSKIKNFEKYYPDTHNSTTLVYMKEVQKEMEDALNKYFHTKDIKHLDNFDRFSAEFDKRVTELNLVKGKRVVSTDQEKFEEQEARKTPQRKQAEQRVRDSEIGNYQTDYDSFNRQTPRYDVNVKRKLEDLLRDMQDAQLQGDVYSYNLLKGEFVAEFRKARAEARNNNMYVKERTLRQWANLERKREVDLESARAELDHFVKTNPSPAFPVSTISKLTNLLDSAERNITDPEAFADLMEAYKIEMDSAEVYAEVNGTTKEGTEAQRDKIEDTRLTDIDTFAELVDKFRATHPSVDPAVAQDLDDKLMEMMQAATDQDDTAYRLAKKDYNASFRNAVTKYKDAYEQPKTPHQRTQERQKREADVELISKEIELLQKTAGNKLDPTTLQKLLSMAQELQNSIGDPETFKHNLYMTRRAISAARKDVSLEKKELTALEKEERKTSQEKDIAKAREAVRTIKAEHPLTSLDSARLDQLLASLEAAVGADDFGPRHAIFKNVSDQMKTDYSSVRDKKTQQERDVEAYNRQQDLNKLADTLQKFKNQNPQETDFQELDDFLIDMQNNIDDPTEFGRIASKFNKAYAAKVANVKVDKKTSKEIKKGLKGDLQAYKTELAKVSADVHSEREASEGKYTNRKFVKETSLLLPGGKGVKEVVLEEWVVTKLPDGTYQLHREAADVFPEATIILADDTALEAEIAKRKLQDNGLVGTEGRYRYDMINARMAQWAAQDKKFQQTEHEDATDAFVDKAAQQYQRAQEAREAKDSALTRARNKLANMIESWSDKKATMEFYAKLMNTLGFAPVHINAMAQSPTAFASRLYKELGRLHDEQVNWARELGDKSIVDDRLAKFKVDFGSRRNNARDLVDELQSILQKHQEAEGRFAAYKMGGDITFEQEHYQAIVDGLNMSPEDRARITQMIDDISSDINIYGHSFTESRRRLNKATRTISREIRQASSEFGKLASDKKRRANLEQDIKNTKEFLRGKLQLDMSPDARTIHLSAEDIETYTDIIDSLDDVVDTKQLAQVKRTFAQSLTQTNLVRKATIRKMLKEQTRWNRERDEALAAEIAAKKELQDIDFKHREQAFAGILKAVKQNAKDLKDAEKWVNNYLDARAALLHAVGQLAGHTETEKNALRETIEDLRLLTTHDSLKRGITLLEKVIKGKLDLEYTKTQMDLAQMDARANQAAQTQAFQRQALFKTLEDSLKDALQRMGDVRLRDMLISEQEADAEKLQLAWDAESEANLLHALIDSQEASDGAFLNPAEKQDLVDAIDGLKQAPTPAALKAAVTLLDEAVNSTTPKARRDALVSRATDLQDDWAEQRLNSVTPEDAIREAENQAIEELKEFAKNHSPNAAEETLLVRTLISALKQPSKLVRNSMIRQALEQVVSRKWPEGGRAIYEKFYPLIRPTSRAGLTSEQQITFDELMAAYTRDLLEDNPLDKTWKTQNTEGPMLPGVSKVLHVRTSKDKRYKMTMRNTAKGKWELTVEDTQRPGERITQIVEGTQEDTKLAANARFKDLLQPEAFVRMSSGQTPRADLSEKAIALVNEITTAAKAAEKKAARGQGKAAKGKAGGKNAGVGLTELLGVIGVLGSVAAGVFASMPAMASVGPEVVPSIMSAATSLLSGPIGALMGAAGFLGAAELVKFPLTNYLKGKIGAALADVKGVPANYSKLNLSVFENAVAKVKQSMRADNPVKLKQWSKASKGVTSLKTSGGYTLSLKGGNKLSVLNPEGQNILAQHPVNGKAGAMDYFMSSVVEAEARRVVTSAYLADEQIDPINKELRDIHQALIAKGVDPKKIPNLVLLRTTPLQGSLAADKRTEQASPYAPTLTPGLDFNNYGLETVNYPQLAAMFSPTVTADDVPKMTGNMQTEEEWEQAVAERAALSKNETVDLSKAVAFRPDAQSRESKQIESRTGEYLVVYTKNTDLGPDKNIEGVPLNGYQVAIYDRAGDLITEGVAEDETGIHNLLEDTQYKQARRFVNTAAMDPNIEEELKKESKGFIAATATFKRPKAPHLTDYEDVRVIANFEAPQYGIKNGTMFRVVGEDESRGTYTIHFKDSKGNIVPQEINKQNGVLVSDKSGGSRLAFTIRHPADKTVKNYKVADLNELKPLVRALLKDNMITQLNTLAEAGNTTDPRVLEFGETREQIRQKISELTEEQLEAILRAINPTTVKRFSHARLGVEPFQPPVEYGSRPFNYIQGRITKLMEGDNPKALQELVEYATTKTTDPVVWNAIVSDISPEALAKFSHEQVLAAKVEPAPKAKETKKEPVEKPSVEKQEAPVADTRMTTHSARDQAFARSRISDRESALNALEDAETEEEREAIAAVLEEKEQALRDYASQWTPAAWDALVDGIAAGSYDADIKQRAKSEALFGIEAVQEVEAEVAPEPVSEVKEEVEEQQEEAPRDALPTDRKPVPAKFKQMNLTQKKDYLLQKIQEIYQKINKIEYRTSNLSEKTLENRWNAIGKLQQTLAETFDTLSTDERAVIAPFCDNFEQTLKLENWLRPMPADLLTDWLQDNGSPETMEPSRIKVENYDGDIKDAPEGTWLIVQAEDGTETLNFKFRNNVLTLSRNPGSPLPLYSISLDGGRKTAPKALSATGLQGGMRADRVAAQALETFQERLETADSEALGSYLRGETELAPAAEVEAEAAPEAQADTQKEEQQEKSTALPPTQVPRATKFNKLSPKDKKNKLLKDLLDLFTRERDIWYETKDISEAYREKRFKVLDDKRKEYANNVARMTDEERVFVEPFLNGFEQELAIARWAGTVSDTLLEDWLESLGNPATLQPLPPKVVEYEGEDWFASPEGQWFWWDDPVKGRSLSYRYGKHGISMYRSKTAKAAIGYNLKVGGSGTEQNYITSKYNVLGSGIADPLTAGVKALLDILPYEDAHKLHNQMNTDKAARIEAKEKAVPETEDAPAETSAEEKTPKLPTTRKATVKKDFADMTQTEKTENLLTDVLNIFSDRMTRDRESSGSKEAAIKRRQQALQAKMETLTDEERAFVEAHLQNFEQEAFLAEFSKRPVDKDMLQQWLEINDISEPAVALPRRFSIASNYGASIPAGTWQSHKARDGYRGATYKLEGSPLELVVTFKEGAPSFYNIWEHDTVIAGPVPLLDMPLDANGNVSPFDMLEQEAKDFAEAHAEVKAERKAHQMAVRSNPDLASPLFTNARDAQIAAELPQAISPLLEDMSEENILKALQVISKISLDGRIGAVREAFSEIGLELNSHVAKRIVRHLNKTSENLAEKRPALKNFYPQEETVSTFERRHIPEIYEKGRVDSAVEAAVQLLKDGSPEKQMALLDAWLDRLTLDEPAERELVDAIVEAQEKATGEVSPLREYYAEDEQDVAAQPEAEAEQDADVEEEEEGEGEGAADAPAVSSAIQPTGRTPHAGSDFSALSFEDKIRSILQDNLLSTDDAMDIIQQKVDQLTPEEQGLVDAYFNGMEDLKETAGYLGYEVTPEILEKWLAANDFPAEPSVGVHQIVAFEDPSEIEEGVWMTPSEEAQEGQTTLLYFDGDFSVQTIITDEGVSVSVMGPEGWFTQPVELEGMPSDDLGMPDPFAVSFDVLEQARELYDSEFGVEEEEDSATGEGAESSLSPAAPEKPAVITDHPLYNTVKTRLNGLSKAIALADQLEAQVKADPDNSQLRQEYDSALYEEGRWNDLIKQLPRKLDADEWKDLFETAAIELGLPLEVYDFDKYYSHEALQAPTKSQIRTDLDNIDERNRVREAEEAAAQATGDAVPEQEQEGGERKPVSPAPLSATNHPRYRVVRDRLKKLATATQEDEKERALNGFTDLLGEFDEDEWASLFNTAVKNLKLDPEVYSLNNYSHKARNVQTRSQVREAAEKAKEEPEAPAAEQEQEQEKAPGAAEPEADTAAAPEAGAEPATDAARKPVPPTEVKDARFSERRKNTLAKYFRDYHTHQEAAWEARDVLEEEYWDRKAQEKHAAAEKGMAEEQGKIKRLAEQYEVDEWSRLIAETLAKNNADEKNIHLSDIHYNDSDFSHDILEALTPTQAAEKAREQAESAVREARFRLKLAIRGDTDLQGLTAEQQEAVRRERIAASVNSLEDAEEVYGWNSRNKSLIADRLKELGYVFGWIGNFKQFMDRVQNPVFDDTDVQFVRSILEEGRDEGETIKLLKGIAKQFDDADWDDLLAHVDPNAPNDYTHGALFRYDSSLPDKPVRGRAKDNAETPRVPLRDILVGSLLDNHAEAQKVHQEALARFEKGGARYTEESKKWDEHLMKFSQANMEKAVSELQERSKDYSPEEWNALVADTLASRPEGAFENPSQFQHEALAARAQEGSGRTEAALPPKGVQIAKTSEVVAPSTEVQEGVEAPVKEATEVTPVVTQEATAEGYTAKQKSDLKRRLKAFVKSDQEVIDLQEQVNNSPADNDLNMELTAAQKDRQNKLNLISKMLGDFEAPGWETLYNDVARELELSPEKYPVSSYDHKALDVQTKSEAIAAAERAAALATQQADIFGSAAEPAAVVSETKETKEEAEAPKQATTLPAKPKKKVEKEEAEPAVVETSEPPAPPRTPKEVVVAEDDPRFSQESRDELANLFRQDAEESAELEILEDSLEQFPENESLIAQKAELETQREATKKALAGVAEKYTFDEWAHFVNSTLSENSDIDVAIHNPESFSQAVLGVNPLPDQVVEKAVETGEVKEAEAPAKDTSLPAKPEKKVEQEEQEEPAVDENDPKFNQENKNKLANFFREDAEIAAELDALLDKRDARPEDDALMARQDDLMDRKKILTDNLAAMAEEYTIEEWTHLVNSTVSENADLDSESYNSEDFAHANLGVFPRQVESEEDEEGDAVLTTTTSTPVAPRLPGKPYTAIERNNVIRSLKNLAGAFTALQKAKKTPGNKTLLKQRQEIFNAMARAVAGLAEKYSVEDWGILMTDVSNTLENLKIKPTHLTHESLKVTPKEVSNELGAEPEPEADTQADESAATTQETETGEVASEAEVDEQVAETAETSTTSTLPTTTGVAAEQDNTQINNLAQVETQAQQEATAQPSSEVQALTQQIAALQAQVAQLAGALLNTPQASEADTATATVQEAQAEVQAEATPRSAEYTPEGPVKTLETQSELRDTILEEIKAANKQHGFEDTPPTVRGIIQDLNNKMAMLEDVTNHDVAKALREAYPTAADTQQPQQTQQTQQQPPEAPKVNPKFARSYGDFDAIEGLIDRLADEIAERSSVGLTVTQSMKDAAIDKVVDLLSDRISNAEGVSEAEVELHLRHAIQQGSRRGRLTRDDDQFTGGRRPPVRREYVDEEEAEYEDEAEVEDYEEYEESDEESAVVSDKESNRTPFDNLDIEDAAVRSGGLGQAHIEEFLKQRVADDYEDLVYVDLPEELRSSIENAIFDRQMELDSQDDHIGQQDLEEILDNYIQEYRDHPENYPVEKRTSAVSLSDLKAFVKNAAKAKGVELDKATTAKLAQKLRKEQTAGKDLQWKDVDSIVTDSIEKEIGWGDDHEGPLAQGLKVVNKPDESFNELVTAFQNMLADDDPDLEVPESFSRIATTTITGDEIRVPGPEIPGKRNVRYTYRIRIDANRPEDALVVLPDGETQLRIKGMGDFKQRGKFKSAKILSTLGKIDAMYQDRLLARAKYDQAERNIDAAKKEGKKPRVSDVTRVKKGKVEMVGARPVGSKSQTEVRLPVQPPTPKAALAMEEARKKAPAQNSIDTGIPETPENHRLLSTAIGLNPDTLEKAEGVPEIDFMWFAKEYSMTPGKIEQGIKRFKESVEPMLAQYVLDPVVQRKMRDPLYEFLTGQKGYAANAQGYLEAMRDFYNFKNEIIGYLIMRNRYTILQDPKEQAAFAEAFMYSKNKDATHALLRSLGIDINALAI